MSISGGMDKEDVVHIYGLLLNHRKECNTAICSNMDGPRDDQTKCSQSDKDKYHMTSLIHGIPVAQTVKNLPMMQETWVGKIPWRREWQPTPVFLPGESHGQSESGYSPWSHKSRT